MIDLAAMMRRTMVVVADWRGRESAELQAWMGQWPRTAYVSNMPGGREAMADGVPAWRRLVARWFLKAAALGTDLRWLLSIDDDMLPGPELTPLLAWEGMLAGARYVRPDGREAHPNPGEIGLACHKVHRDVLEAVGPDVYRKERPANCECVSFLAAAAAAGYMPEKLGTVDHVIPMIARPGRIGSGRCQLRFRYSAPSLKGQGDEEKRPCET